MVIWMCEYEAQGLTHSLHLLCIPIQERREKLLERQAYAEMALEAIAQSPAIAMQRMGKAWCVHAVGCGLRH